MLRTINDPQEDLEIQSKSSSYSSLPLFLDSEPNIQFLRDSLGDSTTYVPPHLDIFDLDYSSDEDSIDSNAAPSNPPVSSPRTQPEVTMRCDVCGKGFRGKLKNAKANAKRHYSEQHGPYYEPSKCDYCEKSFTRPNNLEWHIRKSHKISRKIVKKRRGGRDRSPRELT